MSKDKVQHVKKQGDDLNQPYGYRYAIYTGSKSAHCCFEATVVDTSIPTKFFESSEHYCDPRSEQYSYETICECFTEEDAAFICQALNSL